MTEHTHIIESSNTSQLVIHYKAIKGKTPDMLLLLRVGEYYEAFDEDARTIAKILDLPLIEHKGSPMCGVPYHAMEKYTQILVDAGHRVALCEQIKPT